MIQQWKTIGFQVIAGERLEEFNDYQTALNFALGAIDGMVTAGIDPTVACESTKIIRLQALAWHAATVMPAVEMRKAGDE